MASPQYPGPFSQMMDMRNQRLALSAGSEMFRKLGPEGQQFADLIDKDPRTAAEMARQFGGFEKLHQQLVSQMMAQAQMANAGVGQESMLDRALNALPDRITTPAEYAKAQNILALAGVPPTQWNAILSERMPSTPDKLQRGTENIYQDRYGNEVEGLGGPITASVNVNVEPGPRKFSDYNSLRKAYQEEMLPFTEAARALNKARALAALDSPEADIDLITAIAKAVDPGSVVREGEITMRINNAPLRRLLERYAKKMFGSGGFLTYEDRQEIVESLEAIMASEEERARRVEKAYTGVIPDEGMQPFIAPETVEQIRKRAKPLDEVEGQPFEVPRTGRGRVEKIGGATVEWLEE